MRSKLYFIFVIINFLVLSVFADSKDFTVDITNIPKGINSLFIPLKASSNKIQIQKISINDYFANKYITSFTKDSENNITGLSLFTPSKGEYLPTSLILNFKLIKTGNEEEITLIPKNSYIYQKQASPIANSFVGFKEIKVQTNDFSSFKEKEKKKENTAYVKVVGKTITESNRNYKKPLNPQSKIPSRIKELVLTVNLPPDCDLNKIYIPLIIDDSTAIKFENISSLWTANILSKNHSKLIEIASINNANLCSVEASNMDIRIILEDNNKKDNSIILGQILKEPAEIVSDVSVTINPSSFNFKPLTIKEFFEIKK